MSLMEYRESMHLAGEGSFYGLLMAAMRQADDENLEKLKAAFPEKFKELQARYNAPGGCLDQAETSWLLRALGEDDDHEKDEDLDEDDADYLAQKLADAKVEDGELDKEDGDND